MVNHLILLTIISLQISFGTSWSVLVTSKEKFEGQQVTVKGTEDECIDLPTEFVPQSINTNNYCVKVFGGPGCTGEWLSFFPGSRNHEYLLRFPLQIVSLKSCQTSF